MEGEIQYKVEEKEQKNKINRKKRKELKIRKKEIL
jgi:hypothetical protein